MRPDPFPRPGEDDDQEPDSSRSDDDIGPEQGLFLCLPAENFDPDLFAQSGPAADMPPGPMLGTIMDVAVGEDGSGLLGMSYDQLIGIVAAARRMQSRFAWCEMAAMREFAARAGGQGPRGAFAADELADELNVTWQSAAGQMQYARDVAERLPQTFAALGAGRLDSFKVRIIELSRYRDNSIYPEPGIIPTAGVAVTGLRGGACAVGAGGRDNPRLSRKASRLSGGR